MNYNNSHLLIFQNGTDGDAVALLMPTEGNFSSQGFSFESANSSGVHSPNASIPMPDSYSTSFSRNFPGQGQTISTCKATEAMASSHNSFGESSKKESIQIYDVSDDENTTEADFGDNFPNPIISSVTSLAENNDPNCLVCGHIQSMEDATKAASSFQWSTSENEHDSQKQIDPMGLGSCVDVHMLQIFVLRTLLKFPQEECVKIFQRTSGVSNPADWFSLCEKCVEAAHEAFCLQRYIRQLTMKFEACQNQFINQVKANMRSPVNNNDMSCTKIPTARQQIVDFYSEKFRQDPTLNCEAEIPQSIEEGTDKNHLSGSATPPSRTQNIWEYLNFDTPSPEADTSSTLLESRYQQISTKDSQKWRTLPPRRTREEYLMNKLAMRKNQEELITRHLDCQTPNVFRCKLCPPLSLTFKSRKNFASHLISVHKSMWESVAEFVHCGPCGKSYSANTICAHFRKYHGGCTYICGYCKSRFSTEVDLKRHIEWHKYQNKGLI